MTPLSIIVDYCYKDTIIMIQECITLYILAMNITNPNVFKSLDGNSNCRTGIKMLIHMFIDFIVIQKIERSLIWIVAMVTNFHQA